MMEQPSWEGVVREGVVCPWSVGVETDTGVVDTEGHNPLVGLALRELQHCGGAGSSAHIWAAFQLWASVVLSVVDSVVPRIAWLAHTRNYLKN